MAYVWKCTWNVFRLPHPTPHKNINTRMAPYEPWRQYRIFRQIPLHLMKYHCPLTLFWGRYRLPVCAIIAFGDGSIAWQCFVHISDKSVSAILQWPSTILNVTHLKKTVRLPTLDTHRCNKPMKRTLRLNIFKGPANINAKEQSDDSITDLEFLLCLGGIQTK